MRASIQPHQDMLMPQPTVLVRVVVPLYDVRPPKRRMAKQMTEYNDVYRFREVPDLPNRIRMIYFIRLTNDSGIKRLFAISRGIVVSRSDSVSPPARLPPILPWNNSVGFTRCMCSMLCPALSTGFPRLLASLLALGPARRLVHPVDTATQTHLIHRIAHGHLRRRREPAPLRAPLPSAFICTTTSHAAKLSSATCHVLPTVCRPRKALFRRTCVPPLHLPAMWWQAVQH